MKSCNVSADVTDITEWNGKIYVEVSVIGPEGSYCKVIDYNAADNSSGFLCKSKSEVKAKKKC